MKKKINLIEENMRKNILPIFKSNISQNLKSIEEKLEEEKIPSISIATIKEMQIDESYYFGNKSNHQKEKIDKNTLFFGASLAKPISSYLLLKSIEDSKLKMQDLDLPINHLLDKYRKKKKKKKTSFFDPF